MFGDGFQRSGEKFIMGGNSTLFAPKRDGFLQFPSGKPGKITFLSSGFNGFHNEFYNG